MPIDTNCASLVANLFLFCYERDFMMSLSVVLPTLILKLMPLKHLNQRLGIWTTF